MASAERGVPRGTVLPAEPSKSDQDVSARHAMMRPSLPNEEEILGILDAEPADSALGAEQAVMQSRRRPGGPRCPKRSGLAAGRFSGGSIAPGEGGDRDQARGGGKGSILLRAAS